MWGMSRKNLLVTNQVIIKADLMDFGQPWQDALDLRVRAQELKLDTAVTYKRGVINFLSWLGGSARRWMWSAHGRRAFFKDSVLVFYVHLF